MKASPILPLVLSMATFSSAGNPTSTGVILKNRAWGTATFYVVCNNTMSFKAVPRLSGFDYEFPWYTLNSTSGFQNGSDCCVGVDMEAGEKGHLSGENFILVSGKSDPGSYTLTGGIWNPSFSRNFDSSPPPSNGTVKWPLRKWISRFRA